MFKKLFIYSASVLGVCALLTSPAMAVEPKQIGEYKQWTAYVLKENGKKVCYMVSKPKNAKGKYTNRGEIFALITHRPSENTKDVFSYITGYLSLIHI